MTRKISFIVIAAFFIGLVSCSKSTSTPASADNQVVVDGSSTVVFNGISIGQRVDSLGSHGMVFVSSDANADTSQINVATVILQTKNALATGTYSTFDAKSSFIALGLKLKTNTFASNDSDINTITITSVDAHNIAGTYSAKVYNSNTNALKTISGSFKGGLY